MIVVIDEGFDLGFKVAGQEVVFEQDAVLQGLMPSIARQAIAQQSAERGRSYPGFEDDTAHRVSASYLCLSTNQQGRPRRSWIRCRSVGAVCG
jgi:hypothetical protein